MKNKYENNLLMSMKFRIFVKIKTKEKIMKKFYYCYSIDYDTDGEDLELETDMFITLRLDETETEQEIQEELADAISYETGCCVNSFDYWTEEQYLKAWFDGETIESPFFMSDIKAQVTEAEIKQILQEFNLFDAITHYGEKAELTLRREEQIKTILE